jgi:hypothetical protein
MRLQTFSWRVLLEMGLKGGGFSRYFALIHGTSNFAKDSAYGESQ